MGVQTKSPGKERGAVLIIGLIMMLLLTIIGLASIRGSDLQERMAGNMRDRNLAFQSAEAGLRAGELVTSGLSSVAVPNANGYFENLNLSTTVKRPALWEKVDWETATNSIKLADSTISNVAGQPRYVIEKISVPFDSASQGGCIDSGCQKKPSVYYRVTSRGVGGASDDFGITDSEVVLQSTTLAL